MGNVPSRQGVIKSGTSGRDKEPCADSVADLPIGSAKYIMYRKYGGDAIKYCKVWNEMTVICMRLFLMLVVLMRMFLFFPAI